MMFQDCLRIVQSLSSYQDRVIDQRFVNMDVSSGDVLKVVVGFSKLNKLHKIVSVMY